MTAMGGMPLASSSRPGAFSAGAGGTAEASSESAPSVPTMSRRAGSGLYLPGVCVCACVCVCECGWVGGCGCGWVGGWVGVGVGVIVLYICM